MSFFRLTCRVLWSGNSSNCLLNHRFDVKSLTKSGRNFVIPSSMAAKAAFSSNSNKYVSLVPQSLSSNAIFSSIKHRELNFDRKFSSTKNNDMASKTAEAKDKPIFTQQITKNLTLCSEQQRNADKNPVTLKLREPVDKPLVVMLSWLLARKKHLLKYAKLYTDQGYDVLIVEVTPWQLLWPTKGTQLVTADVLKFLESNTSFNPLILHGFSVGAYVWGEVMVHMARDMPRYKPILDRILAQVWDSAADITEIPVGVPRSIFPRNPTLQKALRNYTLYHLKTFHEQATTHYIRSSQMFHSTLVKSPAIFFLSKNDLIGAEDSNRSVHDDYVSAGIKCTWHCWERSAHVSHYINHPEEYLDMLWKHIDANVLGQISVKSRAKL